MYFNELDTRQRRQLIDTQQAFEAWRSASQDMAHRFAGSMRWAQRQGNEYLLRKVRSVEHSLGPRGSDTIAMQDAFQSGRQATKERLAGLSEQLDRLAPINRAMGLGRVPVPAGRVLRIMDDHGLLGRNLFVVGTNALYAYEVLAGVHFESGLTASEDIDMLFDARRRISLAYQEHRKSGLIGLLQKADRSFSLPRRHFRAFNKDGYMVDLIRPEQRDVFRDRLPAGLTDLPDDFEGAAIFGLNWLVNAPKLEAIALDERGYPLRMVVIDPRAFALHKAWIAEKSDREPIKSRRDLAQAKASAILATRFLNLSFDSPDLSALPSLLTKKASALVESAPHQASSETPDW